MPECPIDARCPWQQSISGTYAMADSICPHDACDCGHPLCDESMPSAIDKIITEAEGKLYTNTQFLSDIAWGVIMTFVVVSLLLVFALVT